MTCRYPYVAFLLVCAPAHSFASDGESPDKAAEAKAAQITIRALKAGIMGDQGQRRSLLKEASATSPEYAPAHWHLGELKHKDKWESADLVAAENAHDATYAEYRKLREAQGTTANGQQLLARWCKKHDLAQEEQLHWQGVLNYDPQNNEAIHALGLHKFHKHWLTTEQIAVAKQHVGEWEQAKEKWKRKLEYLRDMIEKHPPRRNEALAELRAIQDPEAIPWMESILSLHNPELAKEAVGVIAHIDGQQATESIARHAVGCKFDDARAAATEALRDRPLMDFAGLLVESLTAPPKVSVQWQYVPWRGLDRNALTESVHLEIERMGDIQELDNQVFLAGGMNVIYHQRNGTFDYQAQDVGREARRLAANDKKIADEAARRLEVRNERICQLLHALTGQEYGRDQAQWWKWWTDLNEQYVEPKAKPVYQRRGWATYARADTLRAVTSCFAANTLVETKTGAAPIVDVKAGDFVLSQIIVTGEIQYALVMATTVRPANKVLVIHVGDDELECTLGHPFWVVGEGWKMAKELKVGDQLQRLGGNETVTDIQQIEKETSAYNLVVAGTNNYFVGKGGILAHDNTARTPTTALVPGLATDE
jgi:hypothetical protein